MKKNNLLKFKFACIINYSYKLRIEVIIVMKVRGDQPGCYVMSLVMICRCVELFKILIEFLHIFYN